MYLKQHRSIFFQTFVQLCQSRLLYLKQRKNNDKQINYNFETKRYITWLFAHKVFGSNFLPILAALYTFSGENVGPNPYINTFAKAAIN